jgi:Cytochrome P460
MRRIVFVLIAVVALPGVVAYMAPASGEADGEAAPIFGVKIPPGYRDWRLISVAHEEGNLNDLRAILGNDVAITASREGKLPFPDGTIIARLAWSYDPLEESAKAFGRPQSFVAGLPKNGVQFMVKDSRKYASTGGWGFAQFDGGANPPARRCTTPAFPATRSSRLATSSSTVTHRDTESHKTANVPKPSIGITSCQIRIAFGVAWARMRDGYFRPLTATMLNFAYFSPILSAA